ncbi:MAG TPA: hypothetical protein VK184_09130 [Nostocaceae cyanobacterium]|nr:hypothetical protein [Nostocaceae cyanobacterium]
MNPSQPKEPALLLFLFLVLPVGVDNFRTLIAQVILSQIENIYIAREVQKKLPLKEYQKNKTLRELFYLHLFDTGKITIKTYWKLIDPDYSSFFSDGNDALLTGNHCIPKIE